MKREVLKFDYFGLIFLDFMTKFYFICKVTKPIDMTIVWRELVCILNLKHIKLINLE